MAQSDDEATRLRIISHMNKDHIDSLSRFLEAYSGVSHFSARSPKLQDISLSSMKITCAGGSYTVPLSPPLSSFADSRSRFVSMHEECGRKLGRDPITVKKFRWPYVKDCLIIAGVALGLIMFVDGSNFAPGSFLSETLYKPFPALARFQERNHWYIWWAILMIHLVEGAIMTTWLKKYNVQPLSKIWWLYFGFTCFEGYGCGARLRAEVSKERALKAKKDAKEGSH